MTDLPNLRDLVLHDQDIDLDDVGGGSDPTTLSRLAVKVSVTNAAGTEVSENPQWTTVLETVGSDLAVNGDDNTLVDVLTDGVYAVTFRAEGTAEGGPSDGPTHIEATVYQTGGIWGVEAHEERQQAIGSDAAAFTTIGFAYFCDAGQQLQAFLDVKVGAGTIGYDAFLYVQRLV